MKYKISEGLYNSIVNYLVGKPYAEVVKLLGELAKAEKEEVKKKQDETKK